MGTYGSGWVPIFLIMITHEQVILSALSEPWLQKWQQHCMNYTEGANSNLCRTRNGLLTEESFALCTCADCYRYLLQKDYVSTVLPDIQDPTAVGSVCGSLTNGDCSRWTSCCHAAIACCSRQRESFVHHADGYCPMTWDGYSCVQVTRAGVIAEIACPSFMGTSRSEGRAHKSCTGNGTWWREPTYHKEWTNYSTCVHVDVQGERAVQIVAMSCNGISVLFLVPAIAIFIGFRQLRYHRHVQLHINLSVSLLISSVTSLLMEKLVYYDGLFIGEGVQHFKLTHETGCKVLNILDLLFQMCPPFWMLCEGFYLSWLMLRAFQPLTRMTGFYIFGWGVPVLIIVIYTVITSQLENSQCWLTDTKGLQWVVYVPTIASIAINLVLFSIILKVLLTQIQSHPREPNNFRRVLKATVILIPLFGLQQFCIIYSPASNVPGFMVYNIIREIIIHSQGLLVAVIFCFCNNEVHNQISLKLKKYRRDSQPHSRRSNATMTTSSLTSQRSSLPEVDGTDMVLKTMHTDPENHVILASGDRTDPNSVPNSVDVTTKGDGGILS